MSTEPTTRTIPDNALIYLPLPHPLGMAAVYGEREGMVGAADLPPTPADLAEVARVFAEPGPCSTRPGATRRPVCWFPGAAVGGAFDSRLPPTC